MVFIDSTLSTMAHLSSPAIYSINDCITDIVGVRLHGTIQETIMDAMAKMVYKYFPKNPPSIVNNTLDISEILIPPSWLMELRSFLNKPGAHFSCPEQAILLEMMISQRHSVLAVLGMGSRKTMMILFQAKLQKSLLTVIVLPLSSLHKDLKRRASEMSILYAKWSPKGKYNPNVTIISVSIEHLGFSEFAQ